MQLTRRPVGLIAGAKASARLRHAPRCCGGLFGKGDIDHLFGREELFVEVVRNVVLVPCAARAQHLLGKVAAVQLVYAVVAIAATAPALLAPHQASGA